MWNHLLKIYQESRLNPGQPECLFTETLIFNEGWMLRSVLKAWKTGITSDSLNFLPFPPGTKLYSEGQLRTPFKARFLGDPAAESHTRVDGIAGHFSIASGTKSGIALDPGCSYIATFEAKLYSPIGKGVKAAPYYDQVSRTTACLIHALLQAGPVKGHETHVVVMYPQDHPGIDPDDYSKGHIRERIRDRLVGYKRAGGLTPQIEQFERGWETALEHVAVHFETWEQALEGIGDHKLDRFYELCQRFGRLPPL